jgi:hypothetical protein
MHGVTEPLRGQGEFPLSGAFCIASLCGVFPLLDWRRRGVGLAAAPEGCLISPTRDWGPRIDSGGLTIG